MGNAHFRTAVWAREIPAANERLRGIPTNVCKVEIGWASKRAGIFPLVLPILPAGNLLPRVDVMGQIDWRWYAYIGCLLTVLVVATPAHAQTQQQIDRCVNNPKRFSADLVLNGCDAAIQSGRWVGKNLGWAIYNRGNAYLDKKDYCRAIADYDESIRLRPQHAYSFRGRGLAYKGIGDLDRAIADLRKALSLGDAGASPLLRSLGSNPASPGTRRACPEYLS